MLHVDDPFAQYSNAVVSGATCSHVFRVVRQTVNGEFRDPIVCSADSIGRSCESDSAVSADVGVAT